MSAARRWRAPAPAAPVGTPGARTTAAAAAAASKCTSRPRTHASGRARRRWGGWRRRWCCRASSAPDSPGSTSTSTGSGGTWIQRWRRSCRSTCLWRAIAPPAARTGRSGRRPWKQHRYPGTCKGQLALRFQDRFSTYGEYHGVHGRSCL